MNLRLMTFLKPQPAKRALITLITGCLLFPTLLHSEEKPKESLWKVHLGEHISTCPAIGRDGMLYVTTSWNISYADVSGGNLSAVTSGGAKKWAFRTHCDIKSSPALGADDTIYFGCRDRKLYAIQSDGQLKWSFATGAWVDASPAIATNGAIYFGSWDHKFYALNPDGSKQWEFETGGPVNSSAAIGTDGTIYFGSHDKKFHALNPNGTPKWNFPTGGAIISSPALDGEGAIYFTSVDGWLYALNADGSKKWKVWTGGVRESSPIIDAQGNIYLGVNNMFHALKPDGTRRWDFGYPVVDGTAAIAADGAVCFGGNENVLYIFNNNGSVRSYENVVGTVDASPSIGKDGKIYIGSYDLQAIQGTTGLAKGGWPKFRGGLRQTGRPDSD